MNPTPEEMRFMFYRALILTIFAAGLASIPSACNRESSATDAQGPTRPGQPATVAGASAESKVQAKSSRLNEVFLLSDSNFEKVVLNADRPVFVDFYADWCKPCKALAPVIEQLAKEYDGRVIFGKVNTDNSPRVSSMLSVRGLPTLMIFKNGKAVETLVGWQPKDYLKATIDKAMN